MFEYTYNGLVRYGFGFDNPNHAAALLVALLPFCWDWRKRPWLGWLMSLGLVVPLALTYSRSGMLVLLLELLAYSVLKHFKNITWLFIALGGSLLVLLFMGCLERFSLDKSISNRPFIWLAGLKLYAANPCGVGLGNSGHIVTGFLLEVIQCRTLINAHLTLLVEFGWLIGSLWFSFIAYALLHVQSHPRLWCSFAGLCLSACCSSIFDWDSLLQSSSSSLTPHNLCLSWLLLLFFLGLGLRLTWHDIHWRKLGLAFSVSLMLVLSPLVLRDHNLPKVHDGWICTSSQAPAVLYDASWDFRSIRAVCDNGYQIPVCPGYHSFQAERLFLFGNAAEYAHLFANAHLIFVHPPEFFHPPPNTEKIFLAPHDSREFNYPTLYH